MSGLLDRLPPPPPGKTGWPWTVETGAGAYASRSTWPRISIVTPSLNQANFIEETIRSVLLQNYPDLQYLVVDGGSTDGTLGIIEKYSPWLNYSVSEPDDGQSDAINKGLARCDGEWFNWINSDDFLLPDALAAVGGVAQTLPDARLIAGELQVIADDGTPQNRYTIKLTGQLADDIVNHRTAQPAMFYRRDTVPALDASLHYAMDYDLWVRLLSAHGTNAAHRLAAPLAAFRLHPHSKTASQHPQFEFEERVILRRLAAALGSSATFLDALAPAGSGAPLCRPMAPGKVERADFEREVVRRYLWGDMTRQIQSHGFRFPSRFFRVCARVLPTHTVILASKAMVRKWLHLWSRASGA